MRVRRYFGNGSLPPTADSTPFLCSCAKKRGGAPKKRSLGGRRNLITTVTPARLTYRAKRPQPVTFAPGEGNRQTTTSPRPKSGEERSLYKAVALTRMVELQG